MSGLVPTPASRLIPTPGMTGTLAEAMPFQGGQFPDRDFPVSGPSSRALRAREQAPSPPGGSGTHDPRHMFRAAGTSADR